MKFENVRGSIVAMITPFHEDGSVNFEALTHLIERQIAGGTSAILTLGTTGEYSTMTHEEDAAVVRHTIDTVAGRVPVIVGSGSNCTATQIEMSRRYEAMGADALLIIAPYYNKANAEGMYRHFADTADAVSVPCILYNVPGRTGCSIPVSVVERLAKHPNICGIKEASGNMSYAMEVARFLGPDFQMWSGNDDITVPIMSVGGSGVISVYANIDPASCAKMCTDWFAGRTAEAATEQVRRLDLMNALFYEVNPIPAKTALNMMGLNAGPMRLPLCDMSPANAARLRAELVCEQALHGVACALHLGDYIRLGHGEERSGGRERPSILADAVEAVIAAMYLDGGLEPAQRFILAHILNGLAEGEIHHVADYKTELQERVQRRAGQTLSYTVCAESGPDHNKTFTMAVLLNGSEIGRGTGRTKKEAEQSAARCALETLSE